MWGYWKLGKKDEADPPTPRTWHLHVRVVASRIGATQFFPVSYISSAWHFVMLVLETNAVWHSDFFHAFFLQLGSAYLETQKLSRNEFIKLFNIFSTDSEYETAR